MVRWAPTSWRRWAGFDRIIGFDMGGTSTDVCLVDGTTGGLRVGNESIPVRHPIGGDAGHYLRLGRAGDRSRGSMRVWNTAGGATESAGSMQGRLLREGRAAHDDGLEPESSGELDTDDSFLGGSVDSTCNRTRVDGEGQGSVATVEEFAAGNSAGDRNDDGQGDTRDFGGEGIRSSRWPLLVAFGGGGPVHACQLARAFECHECCSALPGALSAVGILLDTMREYSRTVMLPMGAALDSYFEEMEALGAMEFSQEGAAYRSADLGRSGQGYGWMSRSGRIWGRSFTACTSGNTGCERVSVA